MTRFVEPFGRQRAGLDAVAAALAAGEPVTRIFLAREAVEPAARALADRARAAGIPVVPMSEGDLRRLSQTSPAPSILALLEREPEASPEAVFARPGAKWLLVGASYPGNVGAALRTVEVAGADAAFVDAPLDRAGRRAALRTSMNADRFLPVHWCDTEQALRWARAGQHRVIAVEDVGTRAAWEVDLAGPCLFVVGGEDRSLPATLLERCDHVIRIPMEGFVPCYNLQAAVAAVAHERLRQRAHR